jgi:hypothetical protein
MFFTSTDTVTTLRVGPDRVRMIREIVKSGRQVTGRGNLSLTPFGNVAGLVIAGSIVGPAVPGGGAALAIDAIPIHNVMALKIIVFDMMYPIFDNLPNLIG